MTTSGSAPGDEVIVERFDDAVQMRRAPGASELLGLLIDLPVTTDQLLAARRVEREQEEAKLQRMSR